MVKDMKYSMLNDYYGAMLTEHQSEIMRLYYDFDMSLGEIGEKLNITRQGVREVLVRSEAKLDELEDKLGLVEKIGRVAHNLKTMIETASDAEIKKVLQDVLEQIKSI